MCFLGILSHLLGFSTPQAPRLLSQELVWWHVPVAYTSSPGTGLLGRSSLPPGFIFTSRRKKRSARARSWHIFWGNNLHLSLKMEWPSLSFCLGLAAASSGGTGRGGAAPRLPKLLVLCAPLVGTDPPLPLPLTTIPFRMPPPARPSGLQSSSPSALHRGTEQETGRPPSITCRHGTEPKGCLGVGAAAQPGPLAARPRNKWGRRAGQGGTQSACNVFSPDGRGYL